MASTVPSARRLIGPMSDPKLFAIACGVHVAPGYTDGHCRMARCTSSVVAFPARRSFAASARRLVSAGVRAAPNSASKTAMNGALGCCLTACPSGALPAGSLRVREIVGAA